MSQRLDELAERSQREAVKTRALIWITAAALAVAIAGVVVAVLALK